jgi:hypothetical protein
VLDSPLGKVIAKTSDSFALDVARPFRTVSPCYAREMTHPKTKFTHQKQPILSVARILSRVKTKGRALLILFTYEFFSVDFRNMPAPRGAPFPSAIPEPVGAKFPSPVSRGHNPPVSPGFARTQYSTRCVSRF